MTDRVKNLLSRSIDLPSAADAPDCIICQQRIDFALPKHLLREMLAGHVALFAGAGISRDMPGPTSPDFYSKIVDLLGLDYDIEFPDAMQEYCDQTNGRIRLLQHIKDYFDKVNSFSELRTYATRFHRELATFFPVDVIVTTNWDTFFEEECAATPFVTAEDLAFWGAPGRKVLKIHGSLSNYGSIIATRSDYERRQRELNRSVFGSTLKHILATETVLFVGYSCRDSDFVSIYKSIRRELGELHKQAYIITLDREAHDRYLELGLVPIYTDAVYFLEVVKAHGLHETDHQLPDSIYEEIGTLYHLVTRIHHAFVDKVDIRDFPDSMYTVYYHDGMQHGLDRMLNKRSSGVYSHACFLQRSIKLYEDIKRQFTRNRRYEDVAYIEGYLTAMYFAVLVGRERVAIEDVPMFYGFGCDDLKTVEQYLEALPSMPERHKGAHKRALRIAERYLTTEGIVMHHPPVITPDLEPLGIHEE